MESNQVFNKIVVVPTTTMAPFLLQWLSVTCLLRSASGFVDFGTITQPCNFEQTFTIPRPHQLPNDVWMRYAPFQSHLTAVAPSMRLLGNGSFATSWSTHLHLEPTRTTEHLGLKRRGVLAPPGILPPIPTCRQCDRNGNPLSNGNTTDDGSPTCSITEYDVCLQANPGPHSMLSHQSRVSSAPVTFVRPSSQSIASTWAIQAH